MTLGYIESRIQDTVEPAAAEVHDQKANSEFVVNGRRREWTYCAGRRVVSIRKIDYEIMLITSLCYLSY
jgi:hypothetical protein